MIEWLKLKHARGLMRFVSRLGRVVDGQVQERLLKYNTDIGRYGCKNGRVRTCQPAPSPACEWRFGGGFTRTWRWRRQPLEVPEPLPFLPQWLLMGLLASSSWTLRFCVSAYLPKGLSLF